MIQTFDVKLLLKQILDSYWNKLRCKFCITVRRFRARVQSSTCATYEKCNNDRRLYDCLYSFWDRQKAEFCMLQLCAFFPPAINFCRSKDKFSQVYWEIIFTRCTDLLFLCASTKVMMTLILNAISKTCWDFLTKTLQEKGLIKDSRNFAILDYWKLWLFKGTPMQIWKSANIFVVKWQ